MRYVKFNLDALIYRVLRKWKAKPGSKKCKFSTPSPNRVLLSNRLTITGVKITKLLEGDSNKTLLLTMDDGDQAIARLPNPIAGPSYFTVASEVATRRFISLAMDSIPMPYMYDWDFRHENDVGAEWILEDKAVGLPLRQFWFNMDRETQRYIVKQVVDIETKLGAIKFPHHGGLYLRRYLTGGDVPSSSLQSLYNLNNIPMSPSEEGYNSRNDFILDFAMGPSVDRTLYHRRKLMKEHHGPCMCISFSFIFPIEFLTEYFMKVLSMSHYAKCLGRNERRFVQKMGWERPNYFQSIKKIEDPRDIAKLTAQFLTAYRYVGEHAANDLSTISHPNLTLDNIFIDPDNMKITCLTGWQGTVISPPILKPPYPPFLDSKFDTLSKDVKEKHPKDLYRELISEADPVRYDRIYKNPKEYRIFTAPLLAIRRAYEAENTFELRESLINFINYYGLTSGEKSLPHDIRQTPDELNKHGHEMLARSELQMTFHLVQDAHRLSSTDCPDIPLDGRVRAEDFETAQRWARDYKNHYLDLAGTNKNRLAWHKRLWPLNDLGEEPEHRPLVRRLLTEKQKRSDGEVS
jgi:hypothetical protein